MFMVHREENLDCLHWSYGRDDWGRLVVDWRRSQPSCGWRGSWSIRYGQHWLLWRRLCLGREGIQRIKRIYLDILWDLSWLDWRNRGCVFDWCRHWMCLGDERCRQRRRLWRGIWLSPWRACVLGSGLGLGR